MAKLIQLIHHTSKNADKTYLHGLDDDGDIWLAKTDPKGERIWERVRGPFDPGGQVVRVSGAETNDT
jgi:hypothetical protein